MDSIEIRHSICKSHLSKGKSLKEIIESNAIPACSMQSDDRYIIECGVTQSLHLRSTSPTQPIRFFPKFLTDWNLFPIYCLLRWPSGLFSTLDFINELKQKGIKFEILDINHRFIARTDKLKGDLNFLLRVENGKSLDSIFQDYFFTIASINDFIGFWLGEIPCFSWYKGNQYDSYNRDPRILVDFRHFFATIEFDADGIALFHKSELLTFDKIKSRLKSFTIEEFIEEGYSCCYK